MHPNAPKHQQRRAIAAFATVNPQQLLDAIQELDKSVFENVESAELGSENSDLVDTIVEDSKRWKYVHEGEDTLNKIGNLRFTPKLKSVLLHFAAHQAVEIRSLAVKYLKNTLDRETQTLDSYIAAFEKEKM